MKRTSVTVLLFIFITASTFAKGPKYIFYFIGDGMGPSHVIGTELYMGELQGVIGCPQRLSFTQFPASAFVTTFSRSNGVTDSAASGTALSTGSKTNNGAIGMMCDTVPLYSIATHLANENMAIGVATTVPINHATPAAFFAHNKSRHNYSAIAQQMLSAGYDFYAGGDPKCSTDERERLFKQAEKEGYTIARGYSDYTQKAGKATKMMLYQQNVAEQLPYSIDSNENDLTLAQITAAGIDFLKEKSKKGFFMMIEGGLIDYAAHNDDAATVFHEVIDLDNAVKEALKFYEQHKDETLIIVTADHETGGLVLGYGGNYTLNLKALNAQKMSVEEMTRILQKEQTTTWARVDELLKENIGAGLRKERKTDEKVTMDYNLARQIAFEAVYDINRTAMLSWASYNHSGTYVPLFAIGCGAERFNGVIDNTDIVKIIKTLKGIK